MNLLRRLEKGKHLLKINLNFLYRTYGIVFIAWHLDSGMYVAIKKFKESDDNEYVIYSAKSFSLGKKNSFAWNQNLKTTQTWSHSQSHRSVQRGRQNILGFWVIEQNNTRRTRREQ